MGEGGRGDERAGRGRKEEERAGRRRGREGWEMGGGILLRMKILVLFRHHSLFVHASSHAQKLTVDKYGVGR